MGLPEQGGNGPAPTCRSTRAEPVEARLLSLSKQGCWACRSTVAELVEALVLSPSKHGCWACRSTRAEPVEARSARTGRWSTAPTKENRDLPLYQMGNAK